MSLKFRFINSFVPGHIYRDVGSGSVMDGAFWRPAPPEGYYILGDYCQGNYSPPNGQVLVVSADDDSLAPPVDYEMIWNDSGTGGVEDGSVWMPIPPNGYTAMGGVAQKGYNKPAISRLRCVKHDLVTSGSIGVLIWRDVGSGAPRDVSIWSIIQPGSSTTGLFCPQPNYNPPSKPVYVFKQTVIG